MLNKQFTQCHGWIHAISIIFLFYIMHRSPFATNKAQWMRQLLEFTISKHINAPYIFMHEFLVQQFSLCLYCIFPCNWKRIVIYSSIACEESMLNCEELNVRTHKLHRPIVSDKVKRLMISSVDSSVCCWCFFLCLC